MSQMRVEYLEISSLVFDPSNARLHDNKNLDAIKGSLTRFGQKTPIVVDEKNIVLKGNGTLAAAKALGWRNIHAVRVDDLNEVQKAAYAIADNRTSELARWDEDVLTETLLALRDEDFDLDDIGFDDADLKAIFKDVDGESQPESENSYTNKIIPPIYEPKGEKPELRELADYEKMRSLIAEIDNAPMPEDIKDFLRMAATRHTIFNYEKIAEYYAHAPKDIQNLMENSALVIIDFNKAIENGFISLSEEVASKYSDGASEDEEYDS